jgi:hypothetical protein
MPLIKKLETFSRTALLILLFSFLGNGSLAGGEQFNFNEPGKLETFMLHTFQEFPNSGAAPLSANGGGCVQRKKRGVAFVEESPVERERACMYVCVHAAISASCASLSLGRRQRNKGFCVAPGRGEGAGAARSQGKR